MRQYSVIMRHDSMINIDTQCNQWCGIQRSLTRNPEFLRPARIQAGQLRKALKTSPRGIGCECSVEIWWISLRVTMTVKHTPYLLCLLVLYLISPCWSSSLLLAGEASESQATRRPHERPSSPPPSSNTAKKAEEQHAEADAAEPKSEDAMEDYARIISSLGSADAEQKEIFYYHCKNVRAATLKRVLENFITSSGTVAYSDESDIVVVSDIKDNMEQLKQIAVRVDERVPQILVEAQIVELTLDRDFEKELKLDFQHTSSSELSFVKQLLVQLTTPGAQPDTGQGANFTLRPYVQNYDDNKRNELSTFLRYLETRGKAKILSAPNLILRRGSEGSIITGQDVPIQEKTVTSGTTSISTTFKRVGIKLKVRPVMIRDGTVRMSVNPEVSTVTGFSGDNPIIALRNAMTELEVKDGELISIGGLLRSEERSVRKRVPVASAIPLIGHFFRATRIEEVRTQLVIFLTIHILDEGSVNGVTIHRPRDIPAPVRQEIEELDNGKKEQRPQAQILQDLRQFMQEDQD